MQYRIAPFLSATTICERSLGTAVEFKAVQLGSSLYRVAVAAIALFQFASADAGDGTCSNPYVIAGLPTNATNQLYGVGFDTHNSSANYSWGSIFLQDSADFTFMQSSLP
ncbi:hypothetical protein HaLaN_33174, partial [Haematococcus lacustris]